MSIFHGTPLARIQDFPTAFRVLGSLLRPPWNQKTLSPLSCSQFPVSCSQWLKQLQDSHQWKTEELGSAFAAPWSLLYYVSVNPFISIRKFRDTWTPSWWRLARPCWVLRGAYSWALLQGRRQTTWAVVHPCVLLCLVGQRILQSLLDPIISNLQTGA